jgi:uncharacterized protein YndB with AHSA1/START domain
MTRPKAFQPDPRLDLVLERRVDVPRKRVWDAWTIPAQVKKWFTPAPWTTVDCEIDLRPGGIFRTVMRSPQGREFTNVGCYLEVIQHEKLVWTDALGPGFRPSRQSSSPIGSFFTAVIALESRGKGTLYRATAIHPDESSCRKHEEMGFREGWGKALDQLVALVGRR